FAGFTLSFAQTEDKKVSVDNIDIASHNAAALKYTDPSFPVYTGTENPYEDISFNNKLEEFAKLHPPCPMRRRTGDYDYDKSQFETATNNWFAYQPFFPRFIEYHRFNFLLNPNDDIEIYNNAVEVWKAKNPDKVAEVFPSENSNNSQNH
ncbi:MAG: hypothetical protein V2A54_14075, partial [Bacteroidota bacterium]